MSSMCFSRCYSAHDRRLTRLFGRYGRLVARFPWIFLIISIILNLLLGIGVLRLEFEKDLEVQYLPENSRAFQDRGRLKKMFNSAEDNFQIYSLLDLGYYSEIIIKSRKGRNIFEDPVFKEVLHIDTLIRNQIIIKAELNRTKSFVDLCARNKDGCVIFGNEVLDPSFIEKVRSKKISFPLHNHTLLSPVFGKAVIAKGRLVSAEMIKIRYYLPQQPERNANLSKTWIKEFVKFMKTFETNETEIAFSYYNAMDDEVESSSMAEAHLFAITVALMITYASIATSGRRIDCVYDRQNLGRMGVFCAIISMVPAAGIASACGFKFMNSVAIMPFLIIGIGINDMFIIMSGHADTIEKEGLCIEDRMEHTLRTSGIAITVTSLTDFLTFMIGYSSIFVTIQNFCIYTGLAVLFCYINQLTILVPSLVIHQRRMDDAKHSYTCKVTKSREELRREGESSCYVMCCTGEKPRTREEMESVLETYPKRLVQFLVENKISKTIIALLYITYLGLSIWGVNSLKQGTRFSDLALEGSEYYKSTTWDFENFPLEIPIQVVFISPLKYDNMNTQNEVLGFIEQMKNESLIRDNIEINWLSTFQHVSGNITGSSLFYDNLKTFLNHFQLFKDDVIFSSDDNSILASRIYLFSENIRTSDVQGQFLIRVREMADASGIPCVIYSPLFVFFEQYARVIGSTLQTVGVAVGAMFIVTCFFMPNPMIIILVTVSLVSILLGVFGFLHYWELNISAVTMIELIISVGFSVDFSVHICHAYLTSQSRNKQIRVREAIDLAGGPIINGALSTIVGLVMLVFSNSFIFQSFFKVLFMVLIFGLLHAVLFLPVVLSVIGPNVTILDKLNLKPNVKAKTDATTLPLFPIQNGI